MTVVADGPEMEQIVKQLYKLVQHRQGDRTRSQASAVEREVMLAAGQRRPVKRRGEILDAAGNIFEAKAVDVGMHQTITFEVVGEPGDSSSDFLEIMRTYGIVEPGEVGPDRTRQGPEDQERAHATSRRLHRRGTTEC